MVHFKKAGGMKKTVAKNDKVAMGVKESAAVLEEALVPMMRLR